MFHGYNPDEDGPEAQMARAQKKLEEHFHQQIVKLHASLPEKSSDWDLFTFAEVKRWGLKHVRKRAKPLEEDGA